MIISAKTFMDRIGTPDERKRDRYFWSKLEMWRWRKEWREAEQAGNYQTMEVLSRRYEMIVGL